MDGEAARQHLYEARSSSAWGAMCIEMRSYMPVRGGAPSPFGGGGLSFLNTALGAAPGMDMARLSELLAQAMGGASTRPRGCSTPSR